MEQIINENKFIKKILMFYWLKDNEFKVSSSNVLGDDSKWISEVNASNIIMDEKDELCIICYKLCTHCI